MMNKSIENDKWFKVNISMDFEVVVRADDQIKAHNLVKNKAYGIIDDFGTDKVWITSKEITRLKDVPSNWLEQIPYAENVSWDKEITCKKHFEKIEEDIKQEEIRREQDKKQLKLGL